MSMAGFFPFARMTNGNIPSDSANAARQADRMTGTTASFRILIL